MRLLVPDVVPYVNMSAGKSLGDTHAIFKEIFPKFPGWTLVDMSAKSGEFWEITFSHQPNNSVYIMVKIKHQKPLSVYWMGDGKMLADLGSYTASMLAHREANQKAIYEEMCYILPAWTNAFQCLAFFKSETIEKVSEDYQCDLRRSLKTTTLKDNYVLRLTPEKVRYIREIQEREANEEHEKRTNRYHLARGHFRHYKNGTVSWIKAHYKGDKNKGIINKEYQLTTS